ncbi:MAG TPA: hypothetical protein VJZ51_01925 [Bacilli bacterium]|nr:hypothetical protein [Bacilli bacterium]
MVEFSRYYIEFLRTFFSNIWLFLTRLWEAFSNLLVHDIIGYFEYLINSSNKFNLLDWITEVVVLIINLAFITFVVLRAIQLFRKYIRFTRREIEKDSLLEEISMLNVKTAELIDEKNKILAIKVGTASSYAEKEGEFGLKDSDKKKTVAPSRFAKLISVDEEYKTKITSIVMEPEDMVTLPELVSRFIGFTASQLHLYYAEREIRAFFAGMATSKILILQGISGTGKTSLPYAIGKFFKNDSAIISVQPSWRDRAEMIGYLNEFTKRFNETDFLKALYESTYREDINIIILDEMNLARIEYYFAEFLSIMEMPNVNEWKIDVVPDIWENDPQNFKEGKILVPQNLWFVGTANRDDSTFTITDKVYDRAITVEMNYRAEYIDAPYTEAVDMSYDYLEHLFREGIKANPMDSKLMDKIIKVDDFIAKMFKITFGNRILKQLKAFVPAYVACGGTDLEAIDYFLSMKVLRKFETLNLSFLKQEVAQLIALFNKLFGKDTFSISIGYLTELLKTV